MAATFILSDSARVRYAPGVGILRGGLGPAITIGTASGAMLTARTVA
jgi:hypothetical protein